MVIAFDILFFKKSMNEIVVTKGDVFHEINCSGTAYFGQKGVVLLMLVIIS